MDHSIVDVALLTDHRYEGADATADDWYLHNILRDDKLLTDALQSLGLTARRIDWARTNMDWSRFRCAVFRTTWDYFDRYQEFSTWLHEIAQQTQLINVEATIRWNMDKHYLRDLATNGIPIVPTQFIEQGQSICLRDILAESDFDEAIIKPCVSGAARHTYRVNPSNSDDLEPLVNELLLNESLMLQPFQGNIQEHGEDSLMVIDGRFTHAVRKRPKQGDFRVQDDHGGTVIDCQPTAEQIELAERAMSACNALPLYGRVDMIRDNNDQLAIMELELIEPELWLRNHPPAATAFAEGIARSVLR